ncbi:MAG: hypothetical protein AB1306_04565 [Nitrospirota bacterium]
MKIEYESSIEDDVAAQMKLLELTGQLRKEKYTALLIGVPLFALILYLIIPLPPIERLSLVTPFAFLLALLHLTRFKQKREKGIRKRLIKYFGVYEPITCEYEMNDEGIRFRRLGTTIIFSWNKVCKIEDSVEYLSFIVEPPGISMIPKRIFKSLGEQEQWKSFAENKLNKTVQQ